MKSHFLHMLLYATMVASFFGMLVRHTPREQFRLGLILWGSMVGGALVLAYLMYPFPG
ncbi:MAG: hypothetical protein GY716_11480 [bacterium]|nr:hypothetical protein [bacterium]